MCFLFLTLLIFFGAPFTVAQEEKGNYTGCDVSQYRIYTEALIDGGAIGRYLSLSGDSPVTNVIRSDPVLTRAIDPLYDLFKTFDKIMDRRTELNDSLACNLPNSFAYIRQSRKGVQRRQFGNFSEVEICPSRVEIDVAVQRNEMSASQRDEAYETVQKGLEALYQATTRINVIPTTNWTTGSFRTFGIKRFQTEQECTMHSLFAYKNESRFYIHASATNHPADVYVEDFGRQTINEYVPQTGDVALLGTHIKFESDCEFENSSTLLTRWGGPVDEGHGGNAELDNRFGVFTVASRANSVAVDIAEDSLTGSNIAILALPMMMNFVPVAFVADLNTFAMLCYVIFTDIFSTLPFLIKGIELIQTGVGRRRAMGAIRVGNSTLGQIEIFIADCRGKESYKVTGIIFVCVAIALLVFGVWLEVYARKVMQRRRRKGEEGPFGEMMDYLVGYGPMGGHTEDEKMKRFTYEVMIEEGIGARDRNSGTTVNDENSMPSFPSRVSNGLTTLMRGSNSSREGRQRNSRFDTRYGEKNE